MCPVLSAFFLANPVVGKALAQKVSITAFVFVVNSECTHLCGDWILGE